MDEAFTVLLDCAQCKITQAFTQNPDPFNKARNLGWRIAHHNQPPYVCPICVKRYLKELKENV